MALDDLLSKALEVHIYIPNVKIRVRDPSSLMFSGVVTGPTGQQIIWGYELGSGKRKGDSGDDFIFLAVSQEMLPFMGRYMPSLLSRCPNKSILG